MAWAKCWSPPTERTHSGPWCTGLGSHPKPFLVLVPATGLYTLSRSDGPLHSLFSFYNFFSPFCVCTRIFRRALYSIKEKQIPHRTKPFRAADLIVQLSKFWIIKQGHIDSQAQIWAQCGKEVMTKKDSRMTQSMLAASAIHIWGILNPPQWSSEVKSLPGLFWGSLSRPTPTTHGQSGQCSLLIQQI